MRVRSGGGCPGCGQAVQFALGGLALLVEVVELGGGALADGVGDGGFPSLTPPIEDGIPIAEWLLIYRVSSA
jgi:hypothetical protein